MGVATVYARLKIDHRIRHLAALCSTFVLAGGLGGPAARTNASAHTKAEGIFWLGVKHHSEHGVQYARAARSFVLWLGSSAPMRHWSASCASAWPTLALPFKFRARRCSGSTGSRLSCWQV